MWRTSLLVLLSACAGSGDYQRAITDRGTDRGSGDGRLDPLVQELPGWAEASIESVGRYVAAHLASPRARVKALHDYVADRIAYDVDALAGPFPPAADADADWVFANKKGVCAGYAGLLEALGSAAGVEIRVIVGTVRSADPGLDGLRHAWNAVELDGREYAIDATWDAGVVDGGRFVKRYRSTYLFRPLSEPGGDHVLPNREQVEQDIRVIEPELDQIWRSDRPPEERRALLLSFWNDAADADDPELGWAGERARLIVEAYVRKQLPAGSAQAFTDGELERFNRGRQGRRFAPYL